MSDDSKCLGVSKRGLVILQTKLQRATRQFGNSVCRPCEMGKNELRNPGKCPFPSSYLFSRSMERRVRLATAEAIR